MRSAGRSISIAIGRVQWSNACRPTHSFGLRIHDDVA